MFGLRRCRAVGIVLAAVMAHPSLLWACNTPVFRYALENWRPDPYRVAVIHRGPLSAEQRALLERLEPPNGASTANIAVELIDVEAEIPDVWKPLVTDDVKQHLPAILLAYPGDQSHRQVIWSGELTADSVDRLLDSPARREIARRLIEGDAIVWVFVAGGKKDRDDALYETLTRRLKELAGKLKLPEPDETDPATALVLGTPDELKLAFSAIRLNRDDPAEEVFLAMLLHSEPDLLGDPEIRDEPMAFPVFGRGRMLWARIGDGISAEPEFSPVDEACRYLVGACSCQVKADNPGIDLLMNVDWDRYIRATPQPTEPLVLTGLGDFDLLTESDTPSANTPLPTDSVEESAGGAATTTAPKGDASIALGAETATTSASTGESQSEGLAGSAGEGDAESAAHPLAGSLLWLGLFGAVVVVAGSMWMLRRPS